MGPGGPGGSRFLPNTSYTPVMPILCHVHVARNDFMG